MTALSIVELRWVVIIALGVGLGEMIAWLLASLRTWILSYVLAYFMHWKAAHGPKVRCCCGEWLGRGVPLAQHCGTAHKGMANDEFIAIRDGKYGKSGKQPPPRL